MTVATYKRLLFCITDADCQSVSDGITISTRVAIFSFFTADAGRASHDLCDADLGELAALSR